MKNIAVENEWQNKVFFIHKPYSSFSNYVFSVSVDFSLGRATLLKDTDSSLIFWTNLDFREYDAVLLQVHLFIC